MARGGFLKGVATEYVTHYRKMPRGGREIARCVENHQRFAAAAFPPLWQILKGIFRYL